jgi:hypothetical protein
LTDHVVDGQTAEVTKTLGWVRVRVTVGGLTVCAPFRRWSDG